MGWGGGLFDYSVFYWSSFNQEWNQAMVGPGKDHDLDQELDKKVNIYVNENSQLFFFFLNDNLPNDTHLVTISCSVIESSAHM